MPATSWRLTRRRHARPGPSQAAGRASSSALHGRCRHCRRRREEGLAERPGREQQQRQRRAGGRRIPWVILANPRHTESAFNAGNVLNKYERQTCRSVALLSQHRIQIRSGATTQSHIRGGGGKLTSPSSSGITGVAPNKLINLSK